MLICLFKVNPCPPEQPDLELFRSNRPPPMPLPLLPPQHLHHLFLQSPPPSPFFQYIEQPVMSDDQGGHPSVNATHSSSSPLRATSSSASTTSTSAAAAPPASQPARTPPFIDDFKTHKLRYFAKAFRMYAPPPPPGAKRVVYGPPYTWREIPPPWGHIVIGPRPMETLNSGLDLEKLVQETDYAKLDCWDTWHPAMEPALQAQAAGQRKIEEWAQSDPVGWGRHCDRLEALQRPPPPSKPAGSALKRKRTMMDDKRAADIHYGKVPPPAKRARTEEEDSEEYEVGDDEDDEYDDDEEESDEADDEGDEVDDEGDEDDEGEDDELRRTVIELLVRPEPAGR